MDYKEVKRKYWAELLTGGMVLGVVMVVVLFLQYLIRNQEPGFVGSLLSFANFAAVVAVLVIYGRKAAALYAEHPLGFSYGRAFWFSLLMSMLSGVIYGAGYFLMSEVVDPVYYGEIQQKVLEIYAKAGKMTQEQVEMMQEAMGLMHNLFVVIFSYVFVMLFQGGFVSLFTAAIVRRKPASALGGGSL